jgi:hypothetical protein
MAAAIHHSRPGDRLRVIGLATLLVPIGLLLLLGIGEMAGGIISGLQHFVQVVPLILLAIVAWKRPRIGGRVVIGIGALLAVLYPLVMHGFAPWVLLVNDLIVFGPAIVAGIFFLAAAGREGTRGTSTGRTDRQTKRRGA